MIESYSFGEMTINGKKFTNDLKIINSEVKSDWWQKERHKIQDIDLEDMPANTEILVIGNGESGCNEVQESTKKLCEEKGIELIIHMTEEASKTFNKLYKENKNIMGAFHLTC